MGKMKNKLPVNCRKCKYNHISVDMCWCKWNGKVEIDTTYHQRKDEDIPSFCPLRILQLIMCELKPLMTAKEMLEKHMKLYKNTDYTSKEKHILDAMEEYANQ